LISDDDGGRGEIGAELSGSERVHGAQAGVELGRGQAAHTLEDVFANPLSAGDAAVIGAAFIITLAAMLLFFLIKPGKRPRKIYAIIWRSNVSTSIIPASSRRLACRLRRAEWLESSALPG